MNQNLNNFVRDCMGAASLENILEALTLETDIEDMDKYKLTESQYYAGLGMALGFKISNTIQAGKVSLC